MEPKDLGLKIKNYRISKGLTQQEFADLLFIAPQTVSKWERGMSYPDIFKLKEICRVLCVSVGEFLGESVVYENGDYLIAVDGGGTKTEFVLFKPSGEIVSKIVLGSSNPNSSGIENSINILKEGTERLLSSGKTPKRIFMGVSGTLLGNNKEIITAALKRQYPAYKINVESDIMNVIGMVRDPSKCIATIIGTGSVVYGWDGEKLKRVGGWGYLFGDVGSGYDIGREVIRAAYSYADGLTAKSEVVRLAEIKLGGSAPDHTDSIYRAGKDYIASFAPLAFEAMASGDETARAIIQSNADSIAALINHMHNYGYYGNHVVISGGLAQHSSEMTALIGEKLNKNIVAEFPSAPPIFGAMRMCTIKERCAIDFDTFEKNFKNSYN
ncbi:MAG: XRE family transcriptional regulator [Clostridia bacterium]|nr:XRE family transcriptional regulator [Clostridia bacterium]